MAGKVLRDAFEQTPEETYIESWESEQGAFGMHPAELRVDPLSAAASVRQLEELGYLSPSGDDQRKLVETVMRESRFNLAAILLDANDPGGGAGHSPRTSGGRA